jgi:hypothetical protein
MRTSPAVPGVFGGFGGQAKKENFSETLDGWLGLLHNLASLLQTDRKKTARKRKKFFNNLDNR